MCFISCLSQGEVRRVAVQESVKSVSKISSMLLELGFDMHLLGSERYVKAKLENLTSAQLSKVRAAFVKNFFASAFQKRVCCQSAPAVWQNL